MTGEAGAGENTEESAALLATFRSRVRRWLATQRFFPCATVGGRCFLTEGSGHGGNQPNRGVGGEPETGSLRIELRG